MKKSWKKILCSLLLAPCMFAATACGEEDPDNLTRDLSVAEQEQAYTTLKTLASNVFANDGSKDQSFILEEKLETSAIYDFSHSGLNSTMIEEESQLRTNNARTVDNQKVQVAYKNKTGYSLTQYEDKNSQDNDVIKTISTSITKYNGQKYVNYTSDGTNKVVSYVGSDYAQNNYILDTGIININSEYDGLHAILQILDANTTFEDIKPILSRWALINMACHNMNIDDDSYATMVDNFSALNSTYKLSLVDNNYVLHLDVDAAVELEDVNADYNDSDLLMSSDVDIIYNENSISSIKLSYENKIKTQYLSKGVWNEDYVGHSLTDSNYLEETAIYTNHVSVSFNTGFDDNFFNQNVSDFVGTGEAGTVQNRLVNLTINTENYSANCQALYGDNLEAEVRKNIGDYLLNSGRTIVNIYLSDNHQGLVDENTLVPSYDLEVYVETMDSSFEYNPTNVSINIVTHYIEDVFELNIGANLFNEIKAIYGVEDDEIIGVYSDSEFTNSYTASTVITENMVVYVKLDAAWSYMSQE